MAAARRASDLSLEDPKDRWAERTIRFPSLGDVLIIDVTGFRFLTVRAAGDGGGADQVDGLAAAVRDPDGHDRVRLALLDVVAVFSSGCREGGVSDLDDVDLEAVGVGDQAANLCVAEPVRSSDLIVQVDKREIELRRSAVIGNDLDAICL